MDFCQIYPANPKHNASMMAPLIVEFFIEMPESITPALSTEKMRNRIKVFIRLDYSILASNSVPFSSISKKK